MRKTLVGEFDAIYILDLGGNVRKNPKLSGTTHNVFGIQVGVSINLLVRRRGDREKRSCDLYYARCDEFWTKEQKYVHLDGAIDRTGVTWQRLDPDTKGNWLTEGLREEFQQLVPIVAPSSSSHAIFDAASSGVKTCRDVWMYSFDYTQLQNTIKRNIEFYNSELSRWERRTDKSISIDDFVSADDTKVSWSEGLKLRLQHGLKLSYDRASIVTA